MGSTSGYDIVKTAGYDIVMIVFVVKMVAIGHRDNTIDIDHVHFFKDFVDFLRIFLIDLRYLYLLRHFKMEDY